MDNLPKTQNNSTSEESVLREFINIQQSDLEVKKLEASK